VWAHLFKVDARLLSDAVIVFRLAGLQFAACLLAMVFVSVAKAVGQFDRAAIYVSLLSVATYGCAMVAVLRGAGLAGAMANVVVASLTILGLIALDGLRLCRARGIHLGHATPNAFRRMFGFGWVLTVNSVAGDRFSVVLIPHTLHKTTLESLAAGTRVNLEGDVLARYVARLVEVGRADATGSSATGAGSGSMGASAIGAGSGSTGASATGAGSDAATGPVRSPCNTARGTVKTVPWRMPLGMARRAEMSSHALRSRVRTAP